MQTSEDSHTVSPSVCTCIAKSNCMFCDCTQWFTGRCILPSSRGRESSAATLHLMHISSSSSRQWQDNDWSTLNCAASSPSTAQQQPLVPSLQGSARRQAVKAAIIHLAGRSTTKNTRLPIRLCDIVPETEKYLRVCVCLQTTMWSIKTRHFTFAHIFASY